MPTRWDYVQPGPDNCQGGDCDHPTILQASVPMHWQTRRPARPAARIAAEHQSVMLPTTG
jgi:hypothetical protein